MYWVRGRFIMYEHWLGTLTIIYNDYRGKYRAEENKLTSLDYRSNG